MSGSELRRSDSVRSPDRWVTSGAPAGASLSLAQLADAGVLHRSPSRRAPLVSASLRLWGTAASGSPIEDRPPRGSPAEGSKRRWLRRLAVWNRPPTGAVLPLPEEEAFVFMNDPVGWQAVVLDAFDRRSASDWGGPAAKHAIPTASAWPQRGERQGALSRLSPSTQPRCGCGALWLLAAAPPVRCRDGALTTSPTGWPKLGRRGRRPHPVRFGRQLRAVGPASDGECARVADRQRTAAATALDNPAE
jgi:hypothetical protein